MKRKLLLLALVVLSTICAVCFVGCNENASSNNTNGANADPFIQTSTTPTNGISYIAKSDGTYMVSTFSTTSAEKNVVIASEYNGVAVTSIGYSAFGSREIESVVIPASITQIDSFAFFNCKRLRTVTFAENSKLQSIEHSAFLQCLALDNVEIPQGTIAIKDRAFRLCNSLKNITIPDSITEIGAKVFEGCISLELPTYGNANYIGTKTNPYHVLVSAAQKSNGTYFSTCNVNASCVVIADGAFHSNSKLESIEFGDSLKYIGSHAFFRCSKLNAVTLGNNIEIVESYAFADCANLSNVTIGKNVKKLGLFIFSNTQSVSQFIVDEQNANYQAIDGHIYSKDATVLIRYASGNENDIFSVPSTVTRIENGAFSYSNNLVEAIISPNVTWVGDLAFYYCESLEILRFKNPEAYLGCYTLLRVSSLTDVYFSGTQAQLDLASEKANWKYGANDGATYLIHCEQ